MRVVDLADEFGLTTVEALEVCERGGIAVANGASELTAADVELFREVVSRAAPEPDLELDDSPRAAPAPAWDPLPLQPGTGVPTTPVAPRPVLPSRRTDGSAILALVFAFLPLAVLYFGWAAVVSVLPTVWLAREAHENVARNRQGLRGDYLALTAVVLAGVLCTGSFIYVIGINQGTITKTPAELWSDWRSGASSTTHVRLLPGDCVISEVPLSGTKSADVVSVVPCTQPHDAEVIRIYDTATLGSLARVTFPPGTARPDDALVEAAIVRACRPELEDLFVSGSAQVGFAIVGIVPTTASWEAGERDIACAIGSANGQRVTGSITGGL